MYHPRKFMAGILVDPEQKCRGVGRAIYTRVEEELSSRNAMLAWTMAKEDLPRRIEFFQRRGFSERTRNWESRLDLSTADTTPFHGYIEKALKDGITFTTLAEEQSHGQDSLRKIHELVQLIQADMPREADFTPLSYKDWDTYSLKNPQLLPDGYFLAKDGSNFVAVSDVHRIDSEHGVLNQDDTGVIREHRGRGYSHCPEAQNNRFWEEERVRDHKDVERFWQRFDAGYQQQARIQTTGGMDLDGEGSPFRTQPVTETSGQT